MGMVYNCTRQTESQIEPRIIGSYIATSSSDGKNYNTGFGNTDYNSDKQLTLMADGSLRAPRDMEVRILAHRVDNTATTRIFTLRHYDTEDPLPEEWYISADDKQRMRTELFETIYLHEGDRLVLNFTATSSTRITTTIFEIV